MVTTVIDGRPTNAVGVYGDSQVANYDSATGVDARCIIGQARALSGNRFYYDRSLNFATGGYTTKQARETWLPAILAAVIKPVRILYVCSTNNYDDAEIGAGALGVSGSVAYAIADMQAVVTALNAVGVAVDVATEKPRQAGNSAARRAWRRQYNERLRDERKVRDQRLFSVIDFEQAITDRTSPIGDPFPRALWDEPSPGGLHQGVLGAMAEAQLISSYYNTIFQPVAPPFTGQDDVWSANNPFGCATPNPLLVSTFVTGAVVGTTLTVTAVASGAVAVGDTLSGGSLPAGVTILSQLTGATGGVGTYQISSSQTQASAALVLGGTLGTGCSGYVPQKWSADRNTGSTVTAAFSSASTDPAPQGGVPCLITLGGGTGGGAKESIRLRSTFVNLSNYSPGDKIKPVFDVETAGLVNVINVEVQYSGNVTNANRFGLFTTGSADLTQRELPASRRVIDAPYYEVTGTEGGGIMQAVLVIWVDPTGAGVSGTVKPRAGGWAKAQ